MGNLFLSGMNFDSSDEDDGDGAMDEDLLKFAFDWIKLYHYLTY